MQHNVITCIIRIVSISYTKNLPKIRVIGHTVQKFEKKNAKFNKGAEFTLFFWRKLSKSSLGNLHFSPQQCTKYGHPRLMVFPGFWGQILIHFLKNGFNSVSTWARKKKDRCPPFLWSTYLWNIKAPAVTVLD